MTGDSITTTDRYSNVNESLATIELQGVPASAEPDSRMEYIQNQLEAMTKCQENILEKPYPQDGQLYCNRTFDGWGCWNDTVAGTRTYIPCPAWANEGFHARLTAFKDCNEDGQWWVHPESNYTWSNYTTCIDHEEYGRQQTISWIYTVGYAISLVFLLASLFIFFYFRQLRCTRINIHKQLFVSFIIHNIVWIIHDSTIPNSTPTMNENGWTCRLFHIFIRYILVCNYFWMFNEGLYLHTVLVFSFAKTEILLKVFYVIGWGLPVIVAATYGIIRANDMNENVKCWINAGKYLTVLAVPVVISLLANLIFLCNIVRVLITKMRAVNSREDHHTRKAVRATLILVPLLGLQYILFPFRPEESQTTVNIVYAYDIASAMFTSLQGLFVSLIFCFFNGEVREIMSRNVKQYMSMHEVPVVSGMYRARYESCSGSSTHQPGGLISKHSYGHGHHRNSDFPTDMTDVIDLTRRDLKVRRESYALNRTRSSMANSSVRSKHHPATTPSPGSMRRPSQFQFHQDSLKMHTPLGTPSPGSARRFSQFQFHQDSLKMHTPSPASLRKSPDFQWPAAAYPPSPSPRTYRRASKIVEEASSQLKSPTSPLNGHLIIGNNNNHTNNYANHNGGNHVNLLDHVSDDECSQVAL